MSTYAVDWDGTLVEYHGYRGPLIYGAPIPLMVDRVKHWLKDGHEVIIFTSRVSADHDIDQIKREVTTIQFALRDMGLPPLLVTANKWVRITAFWDDRAVGLERNKGTVRDENLGTIQRSG